MEEKQLTEKESLSLINRMIYEAKGYFYESGISGLLYGFTVVVCSALAYFSETGRMQFPFHPFYLMIPVFFVQSWVQYKEEKKKKAKTFTDEAIDYVWLGFFATSIAALCGFFAGVGYLIITIILFLAGMATFITGMLVKFKYHVIAAFLCWCLAIVSFFILNASIYWLLALAATVVWIVPGFILNARFRKKST